MLGRFADQKDWHSFVEMCNKIIGMIGRKAEVKDWPAFSEVCADIGRKFVPVEFWGVGVSSDEAHAEFGTAADCVQWKGLQPNGREWIRKIDVFVLTSKHEQLPTVVLECFAEKTAICGFIPEGGMAEILAFSSGPLKDVFITERNTSRLAEIAVGLLHDEKKRNAVVEDGWRILNDHFAAEKLVPGQLMDIYRRFVK